MLFENNDDNAPGRKPGVATRSERQPVRTPVNAVRRHPGTNRSRAHLHLVVSGPARPFKSTGARDVAAATTPVSHEQEVTVWVLLLVQGLATLIAGYILWAKISGSLLVSPTPAAGDNRGQEPAPSPARILRKRAS